MDKISSNFIKFVLIIVFILFIVAFIVLQIELNTLNREREELQLKVDEANQRIAELENTINMEFDEEYIIKIAREKLNLRLPNEEIYYNDLFSK